ncbi:DUF2254 domain-containing protein [Maribacter hydrothermalis]|uniref:DUF2254 domain-containing protein n=1 Tax=Maribacter hydrothermalis TaxID=1836467 RepID=A0A1B7Z230_9FLAO|nr:DUF2254 domain-containing protein [Maribacter hydrothermalis]APQ18254.1 hypothetical protein BTR34_13370 [Maribacter hydrothermalis]OBR36600.1 hypothetical protein A9200_09260 [Maribacter hydrothermalis]
MNRLTDFFYHLRTKIAFFPTLISVTGLAFAFLMIYLEQLNISASLIKVAPSLVIDDTDTAKTILSTLIGGLISLTVFSFSMVMVLLNQASSNFSPRVLPGIISDEKHQIVLGLYIGTILYNIFILISIEPTENSYQTPGFSVLTGIILTVLCLAAFIYFIHHISQTIQVGNILLKIKRRTTIEIENIVEQQEEKTLSFSETTHWHAYEITKSGYFYGILNADLLKLCIKNETKILVQLFKGQFILDGTIAFLAEKPIDKKLIEEIMDTLLFSHEELVGENYMYGFRQISEIGVKAMSPGINDPGTALNTIDYLTTLFIDLMKKAEFEYLTDNHGTNWVQIKCVKFPEVLFNVMATYRQYCKHDITVMRKLLYMLKTLTAHVINSNQLKEIETEIEQLRKDAKLNIENKRDLSKLDSEFISWS